MDTIYRQFENRDLHFLSHAASQPASILYVGIIDECFSRDGLHRFLQIPPNWAITEMILIAHLVN